MSIGFSRGDDPLIDLILNESMVLCDLFQLSLPVQIGAAVSHVTQCVVSVIENDQLCCASHSLVLNIFGCLFEDPFVSQSKGFQDGIRRVLRRLSTSI